MLPAYFRHRLNCVHLYKLRAPAAEVVVLQVPFGRAQRVLQVAEWVDRNDVMSICLARTRGAEVGVPDRVRGNKLRASGAGGRFMLGDEAILRVIDEQKTDPCTNRHHQTPIMVLVVDHDKRAVENRVRQ